MVRLLQKDFKDFDRGFSIRHDGVDQTYQRHCHDYYEFFLVTKGRAMHVVNDVYQIVSRGSLVFVRPDDEHCYDYYKSQDFAFFNTGILEPYYSRLVTFYGERVRISYARATQGSDPCALEVVFGLPQCHVS